MDYKVTLNVTRSRQRKQYESRETLRVSAHNPHQAELFAKELLFRDYRVQHAYLVSCEEYTSIPLGQEIGIWMVCSAIFVFAVYNWIDWVLHPVVQ